MAKTKKPTKPQLHDVPTAPGQRGLAYGQSPQGRNDRIVDLLMREVDEVTAQRDQAQVLVSNFSAVARALFAKCNEDGAVTITAEELANAQLLDVGMAAQDDGSLVLTLNTPAEEPEEETETSG